MIKIRIIVVDRTRSSFIREGEIFYLKRLRRYANVEWIEVKPAPMTKGRPPQELLNIEAQTIARKLLPQETLVVLDRSGQPCSSKGLATRIENWAFPHARLAFVIGSPMGVSKEILNNAHSVLSLSKLTLTHEMSRLILLEQLYRAFTIIKGEKYHK